MEIITWNINGYNTVDEQGGFSQLINENPAFICLQEIKISNPECLYTLSTFMYQHYYNFSTNKGHNGVYIYAREAAKQVISEIRMDRFDAEGRFLCLEYDDYYIVNVYMPHGGRDKKDLSYKLEAYTYLIDFLNKIKDKEVIIMGDFNIAFSELDVERYKNNRNNIMFTAEERGVFKQLLALGFVDIYRLLHPQERKYTWWPYAYNARNRDVGWRIDYFLVSQKLIKKVISADIRAEIVGSDHCPLQLELML